MQPGKYDLILYRGDTYEWKFLLWMDAGKVQPFDLTGWTPKAEIRDKPGGTVLVTLDVTLDPDPPGHNGLIMTLDKTQAATGPKGVWDLQITDGTEVSTVLAGAVKSTADVTDST